jgi:uncharacterized membrane protein YagU involved in acid resistance
MDFTNITNFVPSNLAILIAGIYVMGMFLKKTEKINDNYITIILMLFSITFAVLLISINSQYKTLFEAIVNGVLQGILCWGVAIGINQTAKQLNKDE